MPRMSAENAIRLYVAAKSNRTPREYPWRKAATSCLPQQYVSLQTAGRTINPAQPLFNNLSTFY